MKIIGITGGSGSGKSSFSRVFRDAGALVLDADSIYHELLENSSSINSAIKANFGEIYYPDGHLDRRALAGAVFADPEKLRLLNDTTHPFVIEEIKSRMARFNGNLTVIDAIGLFESGMNEICDVTVAVLAPHEARIKRIAERDSLSEEKAHMRLSAQKSDSFYSEKCDIVIRNDGTAAEFKAKALKLLADLTNK